MLVLVFHFILHTGEYFKRFWASQNDRVFYLLHLLVLLFYFKRYVFPVLV